MIVFMGLAGSGKSTMGQLLAAHLHCPWISTGNLLRQHMDPQIQKQILKGEIIDDGITLAILDEEFRRIDAGQHQFIMDGSPRTMRQAKWMVEKAQSGELKITAIILLSVSKKLAKKRLLSRRRTDDTEQAIEERFREYETSTLPIVDYLKQEGFRVHVIDSQRQPEAVEVDIEKALGI